MNYCKQVRFLQSENIIVDTINVRHMNSLTELKNVEFPRTPQELISNEDVRHPVVKASAYFTFALEEAEIDHNRDLMAAMATDATHSLDTDLTPKEYLERSVQELAHAESEVPEEFDAYQTELKNVRTTFSKRL